MSTMPPVGERRPLVAERRLENHQPSLHDLTGLFHAPIQAWSAASGEMAGTGAHGVYIGDTRVVSDLRCDAEDADLTRLGTETSSARRVVLRSLVTIPGRADGPFVRLERARTAGARGIGETLRLINDDDRPCTLRLRLGLVTDAATMSQIKDPGLLAAQAPPRPTARVEGRVARWSVGDAGGEAALHLDDEQAAAEPPADLVAEGPVVTWSVTLEAPARGQALVSWRLELSDPSVPFEAVPESGPRAIPLPGSDPERRAVSRLLARSLSDLDALRLQVPGRPDERFFAAGAPWFFTMFGRDSLIAATLALPVDPEVAGSTLRALARRQGTVVDAETAEQPGKILHEVRAQGMVTDCGHLPPVYYGTIDATALWIELLHDALGAGLEASVLRELRPHLAAAATWLLEHADADGDGLLEYIDETGHGLANQGWKDSGDSIRFADGSLASGAIAPVEAQAYAYAAALHAAELLERTGPEPGAGTSETDDLPARLRAWAGHLRARFHASFWCEDADGPFPALALDGEKRAVDGVASNMGHLLGTGLLDGEQERVVVGRLMDPSLFSGFGIRTLSTTNGGYGPLRYHGGSVWTHDTGYILRGMLRAGFPEEARVLARGLLRAAEAFDQRLPELFGGMDAEEIPAPLAYPASCRPQAWAAAAAVPIAQALGAI